MKSVVYNIIKAIFVLMIFNFFYWQPDQKYEVDFKIYDVTICLTNSSNTYIAQYLMK